MIAQKRERPARGSHAGHSTRCTPLNSTTQNSVLQHTPDASAFQALHRAQVFTDLARVELILAARHGAANADMMVGQARLAELAATIAALGMNQTLAPQRAAGLLGVSLPTARRLGRLHGFARKLAGLWYFDRAGLLRFLGGPA